MKFKANLMDQEAMERALKRMAHQIIEKNAGSKNLVFVGIKRRGVPLARTLSAYVSAFEGGQFPVEELDISLYRDDLSEIAEEPQISIEEFSQDINGKTVILVDDVLFTGRTVRAALDALSQHGRAKSIQLAVLVDRGHRELPIRADFVGKNVPTSLEELVSVEVEEYDHVTKVDLYSL
ncbi:MAG: bifunctional pyr operon transcriptional regulator/uracil phosphoribosyltransferase PyrR [Clostridia bacterium]|nr:bifunctional pyr operon transcriptional regulator/uracil phosphoribosyltransferase PyrR [Clostridia bacterium]